MNNITPEEQQILDGMKLGMSPFPTPGNFASLLSLIKKGVFQTPISTERVIAWLRTMPTDKRQLVIDELVACTLRTLEVDA